MNDAHVMNMLRSLFAGRGVFKNKIQSAAYRKYFGCYRRFGIELEVQHKIPDFWVRDSFNSCYLKSAKLADGRSLYTDGIKFSQIGNDWFEIQKLFDISNPIKFVSELKLTFETLRLSNVSMMGSFHYNFQQPKQKPKHRRKRNKIHFLAYKGRLINQNLYKHKYSHDDVIKNPKERVMRVEIKDVLPSPYWEDIIMQIYFMSALSMFKARFFKNISDYQIRRTHIPYLIKEKYFLDLANFLDKQLSIINQAYPEKLKKDPFAAKLPIKKQYNIAKEVWRKRMEKDKKK